MGGRGAASGISDDGKKYGTEFRSILKVGNIKFIRPNRKGSIYTPLESMTKNRVYVTVDKKNRINAITYYDSDGMHYKTLHDFFGHENIKGPHTHEGYYHDENGTHRPTTKEWNMIDSVHEIWYNYINKS